jgi:membrane associated rhomboid family serine protease
MFIPLGFDHAYQRWPFTTLGLIAANVVIFFVTGSPDDASYWGYALNPEAFQLHQVVTSQFLHADILHLLGNMLFLWVFGRYVEDRLGWRFLVVYLACGVAGDVAYLASADASPSVGASGAISGLMGYVLVAAPWLEMRVLINIGFYVSRPVQVAAGWMLIPWGLWQLLLVPLGLGDGVAVLAHLGGLGLGVAAAALMRSRICADTAWYIDPRPPRGGRAAIERLDRARAKSR